MKSTLTQEQIEKFFSGSKLLDKNGQPEVLWHGSRCRTLSSFDRKFEGTGVVSSATRKYGGFFFGSDKEGAEYYCFDYAPEEKIDINKGEISVVAYGEESTGYYFCASQRDDEAYNEKLKDAQEEYLAEFGPDADIDNMNVDIEDEFDEILNDGPYPSYEEAIEAGQQAENIHNELVEKNINPYLYPIHLSMKKPYIHNTLEDGFRSGQDLINKVNELDEGYDGIKITDIHDGDRIMDVYIVFDPENIMILDKMRPENCGVILDNGKISSTLDNEAPDTCSPSVGINV